MIKALMLAAAASAAVPASAQSEQLSMTVRYDDLNLASAAGDATFQARVRHAARRLCGTKHVRDLTERVAIVNCHAAVMRSAEPQMLAARDRSRPGSVVVAASR